MQSLIVEQGKEICPLELVYRSCSLLVFSTIEDDHLTKRTNLCRLASIFDPIGPASPITLYENLYYQIKNIYTPNCSIILVGNFNHFNISFMVRQFKLKPLIKFPTRGVIFQTKSLLIWILFIIIQVVFRRFVSRTTAQLQFSQRKV